MKGHFHETRIDCRGNRLSRQASGAKYSSEGWQVWALVRDASRANTSGLSAHEIIEGQATNPSDLTGKFDDVDLVISTLGITRQKDGLSYMDVNYQANVNLMEEAQRAGVERFCYVHVLNADRMKQAFVERLRATPIDSIIISPSGYFSDMGDFFTMVKSGRAYLFGSGDKQLNPIDGADLATTIYDSVNDGKSEVLAGGSDLLTHTEIAQLAFAALEKPVRITYLPVFLIKIVLWVLTTFTPQRVYGPYQFFLTALQMDMVGDGFGRPTFVRSFRQARTHDN